MRRSGAPPPGCASDGIEQRWGELVQPSAAPTQRYPQLVGLAVLRLAVAGPQVGSAGMGLSTRAVLGSVVSLWRYPVKSMMGEELNASEVTELGLVGDRGYGLVDRSNGKVASAKNPAKWPRLFDFHAAFVQTPRSGAQLPPVRIALPDGNVVSSAQVDVNR